MRHNVRFTKEKIARYLELIEPLMYRKRLPIKPFKFLELSGDEAKPMIAPDVDDSSWEVIEPYTYWGKWQKNFTMRTSFNVPIEWDSGLQAALYLPLGEAGDFSHPEALAYIDGKPYAACDRHHQEIILPEKWHDGKSRILALHVWTGLGGDVFPRKGTKLLMHLCEVVLIDQPTRDFIALVRVALGTAETLGDDDPVTSHLLNALDRAYKLTDTKEPFGDRFYKSIIRAHQVLREGIEQSGAPMDICIAATGHSHIDVAWLWTLGQTRNKVGRTFHNVLRLMEQFPDYHFTQSQPQLYDFMRQDYPELFEEVMARVDEGRWETIGGMWVEADCNLSGSESLARQFLLGRTFFRKHFGSDAESPVLWLPDVFGYAWNLPQLIKQAGLDYFFTTKIGWNQYNRLPYDTFWWQGLDGTRVLTHFSTAPDLSSAFITCKDFDRSTYNANTAPEQVIGTWRNFQQKELLQDLFMTFGYGDGGGGPTREMLENIREMKAFPGMPRIVQKPAGEFFRNLEAEKGDELPVWNGELYLELHRGTYTTQSHSKRANRKSEFLLHDAEFLASYAGLLDEKYRYPGEKLRKAWELVCLNQFHDIIPGSSIHPVYVESLAQYEDLQRIAETVRDEALGVIAGSLEMGDFFVVNPTSFRRSDLVVCNTTIAEGMHIMRLDGTDANFQTVGEEIVIDTGELPMYSVTPLFIADGQQTDFDTGLSVGTDHIENKFVRVEINGDGDITRIYDKSADREVLPSGTVSNQFQAFEDRPTNWEAWDVFIYFDDKMWTSDPAESVTVVEKGPLRAAIEIRRQILNSSYIQRISLAYNSPRIDFDTTIDWCERHILLKTAFPVDVLSPTATYEIQWGNVRRPTHRNTSWDWARFETCAQKWVDLSEGGYGASVLNDCKYGHDIRDNVIRISLLRSPTNPDHEADQGVHRFAYSLLTHEGAWDRKTIAEAYALNDPLIVFSPESFGENRNISEIVHSGELKAAQPLLDINLPNVVIETVKVAEDGNGLIVRLYECMRRRGKATLTAAFELGKVWKTNLIEDNLEELQPQENSISFDVKPYEIVTLRLVPGEGSGIL